MRIVRIFKWIATVIVTVAITVFTLSLLGINFSPLAKDPYFQRFIGLYQKVKQQYVHLVPNQTLFQGAMRGLVDSLHDPFSRYMDPAETARFQEMVTGQFVGIGAILTSDGMYAVITQILSHSPAQQQGLRVGDRIMKINAQTVSGWNLRNVVMAMRGKAGTHVHVLVLRNGKPMQFAILRKPLVEQTVFARMLTPAIGDIYIAQFSGHTANDFARAWQNLRRQGMRGAIIDVRDNPGGYLESVNAIASDLLPKGAVIEQIESRMGKKIVFRASGAVQQMPIVCLINHQSASAAEILAASLQESGHHPIIGGQSYGKGTVQETLALTDGSSLKLTIAKWLTPLGHSITHLGVHPNLSIATPEFAKLPPLQVGYQKTITLDSVDLQTAIAQRMLRALHFSVDRTDGYFDESTKIALTAFQRKYGLMQTGLLNTATAYQLNIALMAMRIRLDPVRLAAIGYLQKKLMSA